MPHVPDVEHDDDSAAGLPWPLAPKYLSSGPMKKDQVVAIEDVIFYNVLLNLLVVCAPMSCINTET